MTQLAEALEEYCPSCGAWVSYLAFNHTTGWCIGCSPITNGCARCGKELQDRTRTTCAECRREQWLQRHADELEFLIIVKGYSFYQSQLLIIRMTRPICNACGRPIVGGHNGVLFHGRNQSKSCYAAYRKFKRLLNQGLTHDEALATIRSTPSNRGSVDTGGERLRPLA
jgi:hypothetical protein